MASTLISKLRQLEVGALATCSKTRGSADGVEEQSAVTVLDWTQFVSPLAALLEQIAPVFDFADVKANGYRSLLAVLECCVDTIVDQCPNGRVGLIEETKLRAYAQSCEMVLYGALIYVFTKNYAEKHPEESCTVSGDECSHGLFPQMGLVKHACYQQMAAKCNADVDVRDFQLANISFGFSFPLRFVMRFIQSAIVSWDESHTDWIAVRDTLSQFFDMAFVKNKAQHDNAASSESDNDQQLRNATSSADRSLTMEYLVRESAMVAANVVCRPLLLLKGLAKMCTLTLPFAAIDRIRADRASAIEQRNDVSVIQNIWNQTEWSIVHAGELLIAPSIGHVELVRLQFDGFSVQVRIVCPFARGRHPTSCNRMILHAHGGGFIAHTSKSHEVYLRRIANELQTLIVSIDYSTAPQNAYPTAVDECYAVYKWLQQQIGGEQDDCVQNRAIFSKLMQCSSCRDLCFLGDSAGGNLMLCVLQRCVLDNIAVPHGCVGVYAPLLLQFAPSPSRMVPYADSFIPNRTLAMCLLGYFGYDLKSVLHEVERDCRFHESEHEHELDHSDSQSGAETNEKVVHVDGLKLCPDCANLKVATQSTSEWFFKLNKLRSALFKKTVRCGGSSQEWRVACSMAKLQSWTEFFNSPHDNSRARLSPEMLQSPVDRTKPTAAPLHWPNSVLKRLPKIALITPGVMDATVDDNVEFAKRLAAVGTPVKLEVVQNVSHGFLNFSAFCPNSMKGLQICIKHLRAMFDE